MMYAKDPDIREVLVIGAGLSGLSLAERLHRSGIDVQVIEGRNRLGGRIKTERLNEAGFDMGPAWFWPGQPRMATLVDRLGLSVFEQYAKGALLQETAQGGIQAFSGFAPMQGSLRVAGGLFGLIDRLAGLIPSDRITTGANITRLTHDGHSVVARSDEGHDIRARQVVLAMPPRIAAGIAFQPDFAAGVVASFSQVPTWMAGQAKVVAVFDRPFWREAGLSGDVMSQRGPMVEVHDASASDAGPFALFGFIGTSVAQRKDVTALKQSILEQFVRVFGPNASSPKKLWLKDWAYDPLTATVCDHAPLRTHPSYGQVADLPDLWNGSLLLSGTETAPGFGGFLEGALEAADQSFDQLLANRAAA